MNRSFVIFALVLLMALTAGCSGSGSPTAPSLDQTPQQPALSGAAQADNTQVDPSSGHATLGYWDCVYDPDNEMVEFTPLRTAEYHFNLVPILEGGTMNLTLVGPPSFVDGVLKVDINLHHPFSGSPQFTGFDVKGVVITDGSQTGYTDAELKLAGANETRLLNADGFTRWWNPAEFLYPGATGYTPGKLGSYIDPATAAILNGYKLHADGLSANESLSDIDTATRAMFSAGGVNARHYEISLASGFHFNYAVDCSWAAPTPNPPVNIPGDFPLAANQAEPWYFEVDEYNNTLWYANGDNGGNVNYNIIVHDWQGVGDFGTLTIESPGVFSMTADEPEEATEFTASYKFDFLLPELTSADPLNVLITMEIPGDYAPGMTGVDKPLRGYHRHISDVSDKKPVFNMPPVSLMEATSATEIFTGEGVSFDGSDSYDPDGYITQYLWDFNGDGVYGDTYQGDEITPTHIYPEPGLFHAKLKVRDNATGSAISVPVDILVTLDTNDPPVAVAEATSPVNIDEDTTVSFDGSASYDLDGTVVDWQWDFDGDGTYGDAFTGDMQTPTATYPDPGTYYADLRVVDNESGTGVLATKIEINVNDIPNVLPEADGIATTSTNVNSCGSVMFDGSGSSDEDGTIEQYLWDFDGDGTYGDLYDSGTDINPTKEFSGDGVFQVDLKVIDNEGGEDTLDTPIPVTVTNVDPVANAVATTSTDIYASESVTFDGSGSTDPDCLATLNFFWDFNGDDVFGDMYDSGTDEAPVKIYGAEGAFNVKLKVVDSNGGEDTTVSPIIVNVLNHLPVSCVEITSTWPYYFETDIEFSGSCSSDPDGTITLYEWDLGADGSYEKTGETVTYYFADAGDYEMQLRTTDDTAQTGTLVTPFTFHIYDDSNMPPVVNEVIHSRTTSLKNSTTEAVGLSVDFDDPIPPGDTHTYLWTCPYGTFDDPTSATPTWYPPNQVIECDITVRVTDAFAMWDEGTCRQWVTQWPIKTNNPNSPTGLIYPYTLDLAFGGQINVEDFHFPDITPNGNVVYINIWATWCGYCIQEMPDLDEIYNLYKDQDYVHIHHNTGQGASTVEAWINANPYEATYWTIDPAGGFFTKYYPWIGPSSTGIPQHYVFDRDGYCRGTQYGGIHSIGITAITKYIEEFI